MISKNQKKLTRKRYFAKHKGFRKVYTSILNKILVHNHITVRPTINYAKDSDCLKVVEEYRNKGVIGLLFMFS